MELKEHLLQLVEQGLPSPEIFLVDLILKGDSNNRKVVVLLDGDSGVSIADCAKLSRSMAASLEENDPFPGKYILEVSSAGVDHPLSLQRQYASRLGKVLSLKLKGGSEVEGKLLEVAEDKIVIDKILKDKKRQKTQETQEVNVPFNDIETALVQVSFK